MEKLTIQKFMRLVSFRPPSRDPDKYLSQFKPGFTLVELLIYTAIITVAMTVMTNFIIDISKSAVQVKITKQVQQNARILMSRIMREVRAVNSVNVITFVVAGDPQGIHITDAGGINPRGFYAENGTLYYYTGATRPNPSNPANAISTADVNVEQLLFSKVDDSISVSLIVEPKGSIIGTGGQYALNSTFAFRHDVY